MPKKAKDRAFIEPNIPEKLYFAIGETAQLCQLEAHVLRFWEKQFPQLTPVKRKGNRRYYTKNDIQTILQIRQLLYVDGFTIEGAKTKLKKNNKNVSQLIEKQPIKSESSALRNTNISKTVNNLEAILNQMEEDLV